METQEHSQSGTPGGRLENHRRHGDAPGRAELMFLLWSRRRLLLGAGFAGGALAACVALLLPNTYTAETVIMPPQKEQSAASMLLGQFEPLAAVAGADLSLKNPNDLYITLLRSRTIADRLTGRFRLSDVYRTTRASDTRAKLHSISHFSSGRDSLIRIEVEDVDPNRAASIANAYVSELSMQNRKMAAADATQRRAFIEKRLAEEKASLAHAENVMKRTQQQAGVIDVGAQAQVAIVSLSQLRAQIAASEIALDRLKLGAAADNPAVIQAAAEISAMRTQLRNATTSSGQHGPRFAASEIPAAALDYVRSLREVKYHELLFELLSKQYEAAKIDESKSVPDLHVIDSAVPPDKKSGPHRTRIVLAGAIFAVLLTAAFTYLLADNRSLQARS